MAKESKTSAKYDVIVVGAGPGGSSAAKECAENGLKVALLEKCPQPGMKVCAGGVDSRIIQDFGIDDSVIQYHTKKHVSISPSGKRRMIENIDSAVVNRKDFDLYLAERAINAGATLLTSTYCLGVKKEGNQIVGVNAKTPKGTMKIFAKIVIAADGFYSITARSAGLMPKYSPSDIGLTVQCETYVKHENDIETDTKYFFYGSDISPCGFGWIYPKKHGYTVGLGSLASYVKKSLLSRNLHYFINEHPIASKILSKTFSKSKIQAACLPLRLSPKICDNGILVVGDAAGQVSPLGGNGIYYSMNAGKLAGEVATEALTEDDVSQSKLRKYEELFLFKFGDKLRSQRKILDIIRRNYCLYMEAQILINSNSTIKEILKTGRSFAKHFF